ncbi:MAG TPA: hypothetical protein DDW41_07050 [Candidatus Andersenbacteria bacterium]|nr:hypothetical protein [Candidatus Andersenbacteria bacterium]
MSSYDPKTPSGFPDSSASEFDPYYTWLSIPPDEQPPNHYRLLGVELFEEDREVISVAVDRQATYVRSCNIGHHSSDCEKLLTEIFQAKVCLLDHVRKAEYDQQLKEELALVIQPSVLNADLRQGRSLKRRKKKSVTREAVKIVLGGMVGTGLAFLILVYGFGIYPFGFMAPKDPKLSGVPIAETDRSTTQKIASQPKRDLNKGTKGVLAIKRKIDDRPADKVKPMGELTAKQLEKSLDGAEWLDLLKLIDVKKHAVYGAWIRNGDEIVTEPAIDSRITVPSFLDGSYEISIDFTKHTGSESVSIMLPIQTTSCVFYLDAWGGTVHGLAFVDGKYPDIWPENHELAKVFKIHDNQRYRWDIQVTIEQDAVTIAAQLDRKQLLSWNGKIDRLSIPIPTAMPNRNALGLGAFQGRCTFHRVELRFSDLSTTRLVPYNVDIEENSNK